METDLPDQVRDLFWRDLAYVAAGGPGTLLGSDGGGTFLVDDIGAVQWKAEDPRQRGRFVNSSVALFADFLLSVSELRDRPGLTSMPDDEARQFVSHARDRLRDADPAAFADRDTWWGVVFEQLQGGLL